MARINIEDSFFSDPRFRLLAKKLGDETKAIGFCVQAWFLAQRYWTKGEQLVPEKIFRDFGLEHLFEVDLAELRTDGVYVRGSSCQFSWLLSEKRASAGRRSAEVRKAKFGSAQPNKPEQTPSPSNSPTLTLTLTQKKKSKPPSSPDAGSGGPPPPKASPSDLALAERWKAHALAVLPKLKADVGKWAESIRLMREKDGLSEQEVAEVFDFVRQDDFWRPNAISPQSLRGRSKNGLRKIENVLVAMRKNKPRSNGYRIITSLEDLDAI